MREIFHRTKNGCGHRQIHMCLRHEFGFTIAKKTVLKVMRELKLICEIRKKGFRKYSSFKGAKIYLPNIIDRNFTAELPFRKCGTDVTEFSLSFGKAYLAPIIDFCTNEIVAFSISQRPDMKQQMELLRRFEKYLPKRVNTILHSDMGWQYQHAHWQNCLKNHNIIQSMSRKGNCLDNAATEQVFGHLKDEFFKNQNWTNFQSFKADLTKYISHWNHKRRQERLL